MSKRKEASTNSLNRQELLGFCGIVYSMDMLAGRWKLVILHKLENSKLRYKEIKQRMPYITDRMLTLHLQEMERDRLITRTVYQEMPVKVEYELTDSACALVPVWKALENWGIAHRKQYERADKQSGQPVSESV
jgi:DNA-binding HxlR family transcriptional regulator